MGLVYNEFQVSFIHTAALARCFRYLQKGNRLNGFRPFRFVRFAALKRQRE